MKWSIYKRLSLEDRSEYDFVFKPYLFRRIPSVWPVITVYSLVVMQMFVFVMVRLVPGLEGLQARMDVLYSSSVTLVNVIMAMIVLTYLYEFCYLLYWYFKERKWIKSKLGTMRS